MYESIEQAVNWACVGGDPIKVTSLSTVSTAGTFGFGRARQPFATSASRFNVVCSNVNPLRVASTCARRSRIGWIRRRRVVRIGRRLVGGEDRGLQLGIG